MSLFIRNHLDQKQIKECRQEQIIHYVLRGEREHQFILKSSYKLIIFYQQKRLWRCLEFCKHSEYTVNIFIIVRCVKPISTEGIYGKGT